MAPVLATVATEASSTSATTTREIATLKLPSQVQITATASFNPLTNIT